MMKLPKDIRTGEKIVVGGKPETVLSVRFLGAEKFTITTEASVLRRCSGSVAWMVAS